MSANKRKNFEGRSSQQIQQEFNEVCFRLGQEIGNERRARDNQALLQDRQEALEKAFSAAVQREQEVEKQKAKAQADTKLFEEKSPSTPTQETHPDTP